MSSNFACYGGSAPYNCPPDPCAGCQRVVIHSQGKAQLCPVCKGSGSIPCTPNWQTTSITTSKTCHGCGGKGWVTV